MYIYALFRSWQISTNAIKEVNDWTLYNVTFAKKICQSFVILTKKNDYFQAASAFKGAFGERLFGVNVQRHVGNNLAWLEVMRRETLSSGKLSFRGLVLTGWSRYDHFAVLCELLPVALPSLILNLVIVTQGKKINIIIISTYVKIPVNCTIFVWYLQKNTYLQEHMIMKQQKRPIAFYSVTTKNLCLPHKNSDVIHNNGMPIAVGFPDPHYLVIILN